MSQRALITTKPRVIAAVAVTVGGPPLLLLATLLAAGLLVPIIGDLAGTIALVPVAIAAVGLLALIPTGIAWAILHRKGTRLPDAMGVGAVIGAASGLAIGASLAIVGRADEQTMWLTIWPAFGATVQGCGFLTIWLIAYPKRLQTSELAKVF